MSFCLRNPYSMPGVWAWVLMINLFLMTSTAIASFSVSEAFLWGLSDVFMYASAGLALGYPAGYVALKQTSPPLRMACRLSSVVGVFSGVYMALCTIADPALYYGSEGVFQGGVDKLMVACALILVLLSSFVVVASLFNALPVLENREKEGV
ncbi:MAG: hypothetical protein GY774_34875 [Planctomycetes bacterium]|nr:hypothetical protein [Planctomycetota bacterium]|tara:strand:- start:3954 stop:4409 length:456 start_codon:yes stop_codon:yes gene_type:complete